MPFLVSATVQGGVVWAPERGHWSEEGPVPTSFPSCVTTGKKKPLHPSVPRFPHPGKTGLLEEVGEITRTGVPTVVGTQLRVTFWRCASQEPRKLLSPLQPLVGAQTHVAFLGIFRSS